MTWQADPPREEERVVPAYALTRGRAHHAGPELPLETVVTAASPPPHGAHLQAESLAIVRLCGAGPLSVAELGATLRVPVGVARVLVGDLIAAGHLVAHLPEPTTSDGRPSAAVLGRLLDGLRSR